LSVLMLNWVCLLKSPLHSFYLWAWPTNIIK
jgi:hypothetical protein